MTNLSNIAIITADSAEDFEIARQLFVEYQKFLGEDLCFQSFDKELSQLAEMYGSPDGTLLLAKADEELIGCVALRKKQEGVCEMKRLFVKAPWKGKGIGKSLSQQIIAAAKRLGYKTMILDTLSRLEPALGLYSQLGFKETSAYYANPLKDVVFLELDLEQ